MSYSLTHSLTLSSFLPLFFSLTQYLHVSTEFILNSQTFCFADKGRQMLCAYQCRNNIYWFGAYLLRLFGGTDCGQMPQYLCTTAMLTTLLFQQIKSNATWRTN